MRGRWRLHWDDSRHIPAEIVFKPVIKSAEDATAVCEQANSNSKCAGLITWCHTFSPSKMWINGGCGCFASRCFIFTPSITAIFPGRASTWIS